MKWALIFPILLFLTGCAENQMDRYASDQQVKRVEIKYATYSLNEYGFKINYPEDWTVSRSENIVGFSAPKSGPEGDSPASMSIFIFRNLSTSTAFGSQPVSLEGIDNRERDLYNNDKGIFFKKMERSTISGIPASRAHFLSEVYFTSYNRTTSKWWVINNNRAYFFAFIVDLPAKYSDYEEIEKAMIKSVELS